AQGREILNSTVAIIGALAWKDRVLREGIYRSRLRPEASALPQQPRRVAIYFSIQAGLLASPGNHFIKKCERYRDQTCHNHYSQCNISDREPQCSRIFHIQTSRAVYAQWTSSLPAADIRRLRRLLAPDRSEKSLNPEQRRNEARLVPTPASQETQT